MKTPRMRRLEQARAHDADRRRLEHIGVLAAQRIGLRARMRALALWERTRDPARCANAAAALIRKEMLPVLRSGLIAADLRGRYRVKLNTVHRIDHDPVQLQLSRMADMTAHLSLEIAVGWRTIEGMALSASAYRDALDFLQARLRIDASGLAELESMYQTEAIRVLDNAASALELRVQQTLYETISKGMGVRNGVTALRRAFAEEGFVPGNNWQLESIYRTETQKAYAAGRWNSLQDESVQEILKAYEYVAILDDRVTPLCERLDGTIRDKDDPFWLTNWPPNHWGCRSTTLEVFSDEGREPTNLPDLSGISRDPDFAVNFGRVFDSIKSMV